MPRLAPLTTAILPLKSKMSLFITVTVRTRRPARSPWFRRVEPEAVGSVVVSKEQTLRRVQALCAACDRRLPTEGERRSSRRVQEPAPPWVGVKAMASRRPQGPKHSPPGGELSAHQRSRASQPRTARRSRRRRATEPSPNERVPGGTEGVVRPACRALRTGPKWQLHRSSHRSSMLRRRGDRAFPGALFSR
jgi:hypothetical protein